MQAFVCSGNLRRIWQALRAYQQDNGTLPPAYVTNQDGKPIHSWRVLILPYLNQAELYREYDFSQPWNGYQNSRLIEKMPHVYRCPTDCAASGNTSYVAIVGPNTLWPGAKPAKEYSYRLNRERILIVEASGSGICWLEPKDLALSDLPKEVNPQGGRGIAGRHFSGKLAFCIKLDGFGEDLPEGAIDDDLYDLFTLVVDQRPFRSQQTDAEAPRSSGTRSQE